MLSLRTRQAISPQPFARIAITASLLTRIPPWNSWSAQNNLRVCDLCEKLMEKAVFAAEALESAVSMRSDVEIDRAYVRCKALRREAEEIVRDAFAAMNQSRAMPLSREQTRTLTHAILGVFDAINAGMERLPQDAALATILRRSVEQLRLAVSGLREPSDQIGILRPCAHIRALKREADALMHRLPVTSASQTAMMSGLAQCVKAAEALESMFGVSARRTSE